MTDLSQQEVLDQLRTRGFETGGFRSPLRHFRSKLDSITGSMVQRGNMPQAKLEILYNFSELEVFETTEPYPSPIAQISMMHSTRVKSNAGVLGLSMDKLLNASLDENAPQEQAKNQDFLIGKVQEWKMTPGHMMWDNDKQVETPRECWEVTYIEGVGGTPHSGIATPMPTEGTGQPSTTPATGVTPEQEALSLLDGKTQQEWNNVVFQNPLVKGKTELTQSIIQGTFIPPLLESGLVTKDDNGVFHVVK